MLLLFGRGGLKQYQAKIFSADPAMVRNGSLIDNIFILCDKKLEDSVHNNNGWSGHSDMDIYIFLLRINPFIPVQAGNQANFKGAQSDRQNKQRDKRSFG